MGVTSEEGRLSRPVEKVFMGHGKMNRPGPSKHYRCEVPVDRQLEDSWRLRIEETRNRYRSASEYYRALLLSQPDGLVPEQNGLLARARAAESRALAEYSHALWIFKRLIEDRTLAERQSAKSVGNA